MTHELVVCATHVDLNSFLKCDVGGRGSETKRLTPRRVSNHNKKLKTTGHETGTSDQALQDSLVANHDHKLETIEYKTSTSAGALQYEMIAPG
jgi:hypothetical protein